VKTHFAAKNAIATAVDSSGKISRVEKPLGLNIDAAGDRACTNCHDPHKSSRFAPLPEISSSALENIEKSFALSSHADYDSPSWNHTNFAASDRRCMPCHNAVESVKFMEQVQYVWDYKTGPFKSIQPSATNGLGGAPLGCGSCHDLDDTENISIEGVSGINVIKGSLRAADGNHADGEFYLPIAQELFNSLTSLSLPDKVLIKQKADNSLLCFTCHAGRTNIFIKNEDFSAQFYGASTHYAPSAANAAGLLLPKIKDAAYSALISDNLKPRADFNDSSTWSAHGGNVDFSGEKFPKCAACHDINRNGHSLAAYKDASGAPLIIKDRSDIDSIRYINVAGSACSSCHGANGEAGAPISETIAAAKGFSDLLDFYGEALKITQVNLRYSQDNHRFEFWNGSAWAETTSSSWNLDNKGLKKFAAQLTYDALIHDRGGYAHLGKEQLRQAVGESLAFIYQSKTNNSGDAAGFKSWLKSGGDPLIDGSGALQGAQSAGVELLCPSDDCDYDSWKSAVW
jgi:mono/diheme cytochrome c family protein